MVRSLLISNQESNLDEIVTRFERAHERLIRAFDQDFWPNKFTLWN